MSTLSKLNYVNVGKHGTFAPSGNSLFDTTADDVDKIFEKLQDGDRLFLYFHGGLVNAQSGMETAERITRYVSAPATASHPVSFVWETGLMETLGQNLDVIWSSDFFKRLLVKVIKVAGKNLGVNLDDLKGGRGFGAMSDAQVWDQLKLAEPFENTVVQPGSRSVIVKAAIEAPDIDAYINIVQPDLMEDFRLEIQEDEELIAAAEMVKSRPEADLIRNDLAESKLAGSRGIISMAKLIAAGVKITIAVIKRYLKKRNHDFYPTVVEEIFREIYIADLGTSMWGMMQKKAKDMWAADDFSGQRAEWHAGSYFLEKIIDFQKNVGKLTIDLVGHSAGSIAICEMVDAIVKRGLDIKFRHVIFMAPACRCELFADTLLKNRNILQNFRMFTMLDEYEKKDHMLPVIYPRSLLYLISGILEKDCFDAYILGLERHISGWEPYNDEQTLNKIKEFMQEEGHAVYSVTKDGLPGYISGSLRHGNFDNDKETTLDSIINIIK